MPPSARGCTGRAAKEEGPGHKKRFTSLAEVMTPLGKKLPERPMGSREFEEWEDDAALRMLTEE